MNFIRLRKFDIKENMKKIKFKLIIHFISLFTSTLSSFNSLIKFSQYNE